MSTIRMRPDMGMTVAGPKDAVEAGGFVSGEANGLLNPGKADTSALTVAPTSYSDTAKSALRETIAAKALRGIDYLSIPDEEGFDPVAALGDRIGMFNETELEFLGDARSTTEMQQRLSQVQTTRDNLAAMGANPVTAIASSLLDVDAVLGLGLGKAVGLSRSTRLVAGLTANSAVLGLASEGGHIGPLEIIGSSIGAGLAAVPKTVRAASLADELADASRAGRAADDVADTRIPPNEAGRVGPDPDYVAPRPDVSTNRPYVEVNKGDRVNLQTNTRNFVDAVLRHGDDMPQGVRILGEALADSLRLDADVPLIVRTATKRARSNVTHGAEDGIPQRTTLYNNNGSAQTLTETVQSMSTYEKTIALHEAAHAKTVQVMTMAERGTLPDGAAKQAVQRINELREQVRASARAENHTGISASDWKNNVQYGLSNNHEFISQLFNSPAFREVLQSTKVAGQSVWSDLVQRVVQAFTGKAPVGTAFDEAVSAFEDLLKLPRTGDETVAARRASPTPFVQSAILQAPDAASMAQNFGKAVNQNFALYDALKGLGPRAGVLADQLVVDATGSAANSATHYARTAYLAANVAAAQVDGAVKQVLARQGWTALNRFRHPQRYLQARREFHGRVYDQLSENHRVFREGGTVTANADPDVEAVVQAFARSRWAEDQLDRIKASKMLGAETIESSPYYLPRRHSGTAVNNFLRANPAVTRADIEGMYSAQFKQMFAQQGIEDATADALGRQMLRNLDERAAGVSGYRQHIAGMTNDDIEFAMRNAGIDEAQIAQFLRATDTAQGDANVVRNLRRRADFDMTADYRTRSGQLIQPQMFVDKNVDALMEGYSRNMSGRIGLARAGFADPRVLVQAVDEAAAEAADPRAARTMLDNTVNKILGHQTGEDVPDILRSFSVLSGAANLANSGIYQLADAALLMKQFGVAKTLGAMVRTPWGRNAVELAQSAEYGARLRDVLEARNVLSGRYRSVLTHLDDNTDIGNLGLSHQLIQQWGQGTRFANGMEFIRRGQSKLVAGLIGDTIDDAIRGNAAAAEAMARFGLDDALLQRAKAATAADPDLRMWPSSLRLEMETVGHNMADALVLDNRLGELPAWMQFSTLGKFILPYMNFVAGTWNKILRRTYAQEGAKGVAMMAAYQLPLQTISSIAAMGINGTKELTPENVTANIVTQLPLMSWVGYAANMMTQGPTNSIAALSLVDKAYAATSSIVSGEPDFEKIVRATPFISIIPGFRMMATAINEDE